MMTRQRKQSPLRLFWMPVLTAAFLGYFAFHAYSGSYGMRAQESLQQSQAAMSLKLSYLRAQRRNLEQRIASVRPDNLDADIIDMEARAALNLMRADEIVISLGAN